MENMEARERILEAIQGNLRIHLRNCGANVNDGLTENMDGSFHYVPECTGCKNRLAHAQNALRRFGFYVTYAEESYRLRIIPEGIIACTCMYTEHACACTERGTGYDTPLKKVKPVHRSLSKLCATAAYKRARMEVIERLARWDPRAFAQCGNVTKACGRFFELALPSAWKVVSTYRNDGRRDTKTVCKYCYKKLSAPCKAEGKCFYKAANGTPIYVLKSNKVTHGFCWECFKNKYLMCPSCRKWCKKTRTQRRRESLGHDGKRCAHCGAHNQCKACRKECRANSAPSTDRADYDFVKGESFKDMPFKRTFGVEVEVSSPQWSGGGCGCGDCEDCENDSSGESGSMAYDVRRNTRFKATGDGSLNNGFEAVSPILQGDNGLRELKKLCDMDWPTELDKSCGLHVHLSTKGLSWLDCVKALRCYAYLEPVLYAMQPRSRQCNNDDGYSRPLVDKVQNGLAAADFRRNGKLTRKRFLQWHYGGRIPSTVRNALGKYGTTCRYLGVNFQSHFHRRTIEIRYHSGTVSYRKIKNWILINQAIVEAAQVMSWKDIKNLAVTMRRNGSGVKPRMDFMREVFSKTKGLDADNLMEYVRERINKFAERSSCNQIARALQHRDAA